MERNEYGLASEYPVFVVPSAGRVRLATVTEGEYTPLHTDRKCLSLSPSGGPNFPGETCLLPCERGLLLAQCQNRRGRHWTPIRELCRKFAHPRTDYYRRRKPRPTNLLLHDYFGGIEVRHPEP
jgi:hypothetical protein